MNYFHPSIHSINLLKQRQLTHKKELVSVLIKKYLNCQLLHIYLYIKKLINLIKKIKRLNKYEFGIKTTKYYKKNGINSIKE